MPIETGVETQTPHPLSLRTRDDARAALARAFEEAAVMPGTLLPHEMLTSSPRWRAASSRRCMALDDGALVGERSRGRGPTSSSTRSTRPSSAWWSAAGWCREDRLPELGTGLFLQDIGKLALPPSLVHKPGPLAPDEWELMMKHPLLGLEFLRDDSISAGEVGRALAPRALGRLRLPRRAGRRGDLAVRAHRRGGRRLRRRHERALPRARRAARTRAST